MASSLTSTDVKDALPDYMARRITSDHSNAFGDAARKANLWVASRYRNCGLSSSDIDWDDDLVREAALERAKYEIYALQETEDVAEDKKENASELIGGVLGGCGAEDGDESPGSAVVAGEKPEWLGGFEGRSDPRKGGTRRVP